MKAEGTVGARAVEDGAVTPLAVGPDSVLYNRPVAGKYTEAALAGRLFSAANQAAVATTANLTAAYTGLGIANPSGSGKNLIIMEFGAAWSLTGSTAGAIGLMTATPGDMAASITPRPALYGSAASIALVDADATAGTPVLERVLGHYGTGNTNLFTSADKAIYEIDGSIILPPGRALITYTSLATTTAAIFHFVWEERNQ